MYSEDDQCRADIEAESDVDAVLKALAHPFRRAVLAILAEAYYSAPQRVYFLASGALDGLAGWADGIARADPADWIPYEVEG